MPIYIICDYYTHKTDLADLSSFWKKINKICGKYCNVLYFKNQSIYPLGKKNPCVLTKFLVFSLYFDKISKFPVFSLTGIFLGQFPCFPCAVGTQVCAPCTRPKEAKATNQRGEPGRERCGAGRVVHLHLDADPPYPAHDKQHVSASNNIHCAHKATLKKNVVSGPAAG